MKYILLLFFLFFISCNSGIYPQEKEIHKICIEEALTRFEKRTLSKYAKEIRYVKLETNGGCFITQNIHRIYLVNGLIYVHDDEPYLKVFDEQTGKFIFNVGSKGRGRGELPYLSAVDINSKENRILLNGQYSNQFDLKGNFIGEHIKPDTKIDDASVSYNVVQLDKNIYGAGFKTYSGYQDNALIIYDSDNKTLNYLKSYYHASDENKKSWSPRNQSGTWCRNNDDIFFNQGWCDTIYRYNKTNISFESFIVINFGKHRQSNVSGYANLNRDMIYIEHFLDNGIATFFHFFSSNLSPEPFYDEVVLSNQRRRFLNHNLLGVYDKKEYTFTFILQSIKGLPGLGNDLDEGLPFFPKSISSENELVDYYHADRFLEMAAKLPNPSESFKEFIKGISEEDNPIIIIAK